MPSDIPNLNTECFPLKELTKWNLTQKCCMYKTWTGCPAHQDHIHDDPTIAKGIVLSSVLRPMKNVVGDIWKVVMLVAWDRNRDPALANDILNKKRSHYSIGAYTGDYSCSICGHLYSNGEENGWCPHVNNDRKLKVYNNMLAYWNVMDSCGFEISTVTVGAFLSTHDTPYFLYDDN